MVKIETIWLLGMRGLHSFLMEEVPLLAFSIGWSLDSADHRDRNGRLPLRFLIIQSTLRKKYHCFWCNYGSWWVLQQCQREGLGKWTCHVNYHCDAVFPSGKNNKSRAVSFHRGSNNLRCSSKSLHICFETRTGAVSFDRVHGAGKLFQSLLPAWRVKQNTKEIKESAPPGRVTPCCVHELASLHTGRWGQKCGL